jgi:AcrR family transcriptional regulator
MIHFFPTGSGTLPAMAELSTTPDNRRDLRGLLTRRVLLTTAERLFATHGIARTSTRQITSEAGISRDAIHYHFGSKAALVEAVLDWRLEILRTEFERMFHTVGAGVPQIHDIAATLVTAAAEMAREESGQYYHSFLLALVNDHELSHLATSRPSPQIETIVHHLTPLTPFLTDTERLYRAGQALLLLLHGVGTRSVSGWATRYQVDVDEDETLAMLTDVLAAVLGAGASGASTAAPAPAGGRAAR